MERKVDVFCRENKALIERTGYDHVIYHFHISIHHKYLYVEVPKVASSSIKLMLQRVELNDPSYSVYDGDVHDRNFSPLLEPLQVASFRATLASADMFKFCFVRHPATRVLSCYLDKIISDRRDDRLIAIIQRLLGNEESPHTVRISFPQFLEAVARQAPTDMDPHWRPQFLMVSPDMVPYDFVGRFERLENDLKKIFSKLGIEFSWYVTAKRDHGTEADYRLTEFYGPKEIKLLEKVYADDFATFDYGGVSRSGRIEGPPAAAA